MAITDENKKAMIPEFQINPKDTGSSSFQIALLTEHIQRLAEHLKKNSKDFSSQRGLLKMVNRRRKLLNYLKKHDKDRYQKLIQRLELRK